MTMSLIPIRLKQPAYLAIAAALLASAGPCLAADAASSSPFPGLEVVSSKSVERLYRRPDTNIAAYDKIMIGTPLVEFSKEWNPRNYGRFGVSALELQKIRMDLSDLAKVTFSKALADGGYEVVTTPGPGVLVITPNIVNLYMNAPDTSSPGRTRSYVMSAGAMTLALLANDAVTGTLLAVAMDHQRGPQFARLQWATSAFNRVQASIVLKGWAEQLRQDLDAARGK
jgi:hypothetical protein